jgi:hypothetical protein
MNRIERPSERNRPYKQRSLLNLVRWLLMICATSIFLAYATGAVAISSDGNAIEAKTTKTSPVSFAPRGLPPVTHISVIEVAEKAEVAAEVPHRSSETGYAMPTLAADQVIIGSPRQPIVLHLSFKADGVVPDHSLIAIHGLPKGTVLSAGHSDGVSGWLLAPDDLAAGLSLTPIDGADGTSDLVIEVLTPEGRVASEQHAQLIVSGRTESGQGRESASSPTLEQIQVLLAKGRELQRVGYLAGARLFFRRAADAGSSEGASALGETYDPVEFQKLGVRGMVPDQALARKWYDRAQELDGTHLKQTGATQ